MAAVAVPLLMLTGFASGTAAATEPPAVATPCASSVTDPEPPGDPDELIQCLRDHGVEVSVVSEPVPVPGNGPIIVEGGQGGPKDIQTAPGMEPVIVHGEAGGSGEVPPALKDCQQFLPEIDARPIDREQVIAFAQCMQANGVPDFPLPDKRGNVVVEESVVVEEKDGVQPLPPRIETRPSTPP